jgi:hypothetical protein
MSWEAATKPGSEKRVRIDVGDLHAATLRQTRHQFQAVENARNAASDKVIT